VWQSKKLSSLFSKIEAKVDMGIPFVAAITRHSFLDMSLRQGMDVYLTFKAADVHVF
jgi:molybdopterin-binding protein